MAKIFRLRQRVLNLIRKKNLNYVHIKTSAATFQVQHSNADKIKIGSNGKFSTEYVNDFVESSTGNLSAVKDSKFSIKSNGENKSIQVNGTTYTTNNRLSVSATDNSSIVLSGVVILKDGESVPVEQGTLSVSGDTDGVEIKVSGVNFWSIKIWRTVALSLTTAQPTRARAMKLLSRLRTRR